MTRRGRRHLHEARRPYLVNADDLEEWSLRCGCRHDTNPTSLPLTGLPPNHDLDVLVERRQSVHQAFDGDACQLVVKRRNLRLREEAGILRIELKGNLAAMLGATVQSKRPPETGDLSLQVSMLAGARNQQYWSSGTAASTHFSIHCAAPERLSG